MQLLLKFDQAIYRMILGCVLALSLAGFASPAFAEEEQAASVNPGTQYLTTGEESLAVKTVTNAVAAVIVGDAPANRSEAQTIAVVLNDEKAIFAKGSIELTRLSDNKVLSFSSINTSGNLAVFTLDNLPEGSYYTSKLSFSLEDSAQGFQQVFPMDEANVFSISYSGATDFSVGDVDVAVYDLDGNNKLSSTTALASTVGTTTNNALDTGVVSLKTVAPLKQNLLQATGPVSTKAPAAKGNPLAYKFVIALDPGHGGRDGGASGNNLSEKVINLKIANACKAALEKYQNIEVYLTRTTDVYVGLSERVANAKSKGARVFVSIHINAANSSAANGAEVYYPINSAYLKNQTHGMGANIAQSILDELLNLGFGLTNRGIKTRETTAGGTYADGSKSDYYSVIYNSRTRGIPGLIVEHAFISNSYDAKIMAKDANLTKMGQADALGIAKAYNFATGYWYNDNGTWKYWTGSQYVKNKWLYRAGTWYYFNSKEQPATGLQKLNGVWYYFDKTSFNNRSGWILDGGKWYYGRSDNAVKESWSLKPGWLKLDAWYYCDPSQNGHPAKTGLFTVAGVKYYADSNCRLVTNKDITIDGTTYRASSSGALTKLDHSAITKATDAKMKGKTGWIKDSLGWHYYIAGVSQSGWIKLGRYWYYLDPTKSGHPANTGLFQPQGESNWYYANSDCQMQTGWIKVGNNWHYAKSSGAMASGWLWWGSKWYYLDPSAKAHPAKTGFFSDGNKRYYCEPGSCAMKTGWIKASNKWHYASGSGALVSGWIKLSGKWYYLDPVQTNHPAKENELFLVNGVKYYCDSSCAMVANKDVTVGGKKYHAAASGALTEVVPAKEDYAIMGKPGTTVAKMVSAYNTATKSNGKSYPASTYKNKGAATIQDFCQILYDEAVAEGVRPEVVFAQSMLETGWLAFGGQVSVSQCNFAGIGAVDGGAEGATFKDVRTGLRAQVQHLKAYASTDKLKNTCVDPRFNLVKRGCATTVINLGQKENPNGYGWATGAGYGSKIINLMKTYKLI